MDRVIPPVSKTLTETMVKKGNPDCFKELVALARCFGVNFDELSAGEKRELPLVFSDGTKSVIRFYVVRGRNGRKDKRYNIPAGDLRAQAAVGDTLAFTFELNSTTAETMMCVNVTRQPEYSFLLTEDMQLPSEVA